MVRRISIAFKSFIIIIEIPVIFGVVNFQNFAVGDANETNASNPIESRAAFPKVMDQYNREGTIGEGGVGETTFFEELLDFFSLVRFCHDYLVIVQHFHHENVIAVLFVSFLLTRGLGGVRQLAKAVLGRQSCRFQYGIGATLAPMTGAQNIPQGFVVIVARDGCGRQFLESEQQQTTRFNPKILIATTITSYRLVS